MSLRLEISIDPAYDYSKGLPDGTKGNYGIGSCRMRFIVRGEHGCMHWAFSTGWYLPEIQDQHWKQGQRFAGISSSDLGSHGYQPVWYHDIGCHCDRCQVDRECCNLLDAPCYYTGHGTGTDLIDVLLTKGSDAIWDILDDLYRRDFQD